LYAGYIDAATASVKAINAVEKMEAQLYEISNTRLPPKAKPVSFA
jgi:hypothetical protein